MRMLAKGEPFMGVEADSLTKEQRTGENGEKLLWHELPDPYPVFSEAFLYETIGKGDARFVLGVAEEYSHLIELLGEHVVRRLLDLKVAKGQRMRFRADLETALENWE
jgi:hypothetical protein